MYALNGIVRGLAVIVWLLAGVFMLRWNGTDIWILVDILAFAIGGGLLWELPEDSEQGD